MKRSARSLWRNADGAVAPMVALSLTALVAAGGIAFDYARVASMDTELQSAADQAALAAASQLDGQTGARARATAAAEQMVSNLTYMANDKCGTAVKIENASPTTSCPATGSITFYQDAARSQLATSDANANFVLVTVDSRKAVYALTPIVAAFSGQLQDSAFAGLHQAVCKVPPVMICNPQETATKKTFDVTTLVGKGLKLVTQGGGSGTWAPGNYGYLDTNINSVNGQINQLRAGLGWQNPPGDCVQETGVNTKPGVSTTVTDALNTRFDIYANANTSCLSGGTCPASINTVKDVVRNANSGSNCGWSNNVNNKGWHQPAVGYGWGTIPSSVAALSTIPANMVMGYPPDICHAVPSGTTGACTSPIGDGVWDRNAYFKVNYGWSSTQWQSDTGLSATATRYDVYKWEIAHRGQTVDGVTVLGNSPTGATGSTPVNNRQPVCSPLQGYGNGVIPDDTNIDRRKISVAVVNCTENSVNGSSQGVPVKDWIDVFLVQPSLDRGTVTNAGDIYVEVVGRTNNATDSGAVQLIKKSVPYLIQ